MSTSFFLGLIRKSLHSRQTRDKSSRHSRKGAVVLWILIGIAFLIAAAIIVVLYLGAPPSNVKYDVIEGKMTAPQQFPAVLDSDVTVTYQVTIKSVTVPYGAGPGYPLLSSTKPKPLENSRVKFILKNGDAAFADGSTTKTVDTDPQGNANVIIKTARDGDDILNFEIQYRTGILFRTWQALPDPDAVVFEVDHL